MASSNEAELQQPRRSSRTRFERDCRRCRRCDFRGGERQGRESLKIEEERGVDLGRRQMGWKLTLLASNPKIARALISFPLEELKHMVIGDILRAERINDAEMFNVVALVVGKGDPRGMQTKTGKDLKRLVIVVEDLEQNR
ncbi:hypothetical protein PIB30_059677 [Stylosanthes scabra]|uniref:Uncharacterized protein n=1 Tax=Stylosanthes scabra TaxID=79078 RepID=A0ABU6YHS4_9FABA|nr:hypothetical protein [Stylosanthes scabra]